MVFFFSLPPLPGEVSFYLKNSHPWVKHRSAYGKCARGEQGRGSTALAPEAPASDPWEPAVAAGDALSSRSLCSWNSAWHHSKERNSLISSYKKLFVIIFFFLREKYCRRSSPSSPTARPHCQRRLLCPHLSSAQAVLSRD